MLNARSDLGQPRLVDRLDELFVGFALSQARKGADDFGKSIKAAVEAS